MNDSNQATVSPTFGTLLIRRKSNHRPSELELRLRPLSRKIRIVEKLAGNAHIMVSGSPSLAIRIYTKEEIIKLEENMYDSEDVDGLRQFRDSFEHSMVFFVLIGDEEQNSQMGRRESFTNAAQQALLTGGKGTVRTRTTRTLIVPDITQVINAISSVIQSLSPKKREKKKMYFTQIANQNYLPDNATGRDPSPRAIANHVSKTFNEWAERMGMPVNDPNVLLSIMGSLGDVVTADDKALDEVPIRNATKDIISMFFNPSQAKGSSMDVNVQDAFDTGSITEAYDDIDDNEFRQIPDPSTAMEDVQQIIQNTNDNFDNFYQEYNQDHHMQSRFGESNDFSIDVEFTPIKPSYHNSQYYSGDHYSERSSIIPNSFGQTTQSGYEYTPSHFVGVPSFRTQYSSSRRSKQQEDDDMLVYQQLM